jgi:uncharacterized protein YukE
MTDLTPNDVRRWDAGAVLKVFQVANARGQTLQQFGENLGQTGQLLADWHGEAGSAFHTSLGRLRTDIETDGQESREVAGAVGTAVGDVQTCKSLMSQVDETAESLGFTITEDWKVNTSDTAALLMGPEEAELERQVLQTDLDTVKAKAHTTDLELATAMRAAVGDSLLSADGGAGAYSPPLDQPDNQPPKDGKAPGAESADGGAGEGGAFSPTPNDVAIGTEGAIAGGTADGVRQTVLQAIKDSPGTGVGKAPQGLLDWFEDPKIKGFELTGFSRVAGVVGVASAVPAVMSDVGEGNSVAEAVTREGAGVVAGMWAGAEAGGVIGSFVPIPGVGTAVGIAAGAVIGAGASWVASNGVKLAWQPVSNAIGSAVHGVESIFGFG